MIVLDVSATLPYLLYREVEIENILLQADRIIAPELFLSESGNALLLYVRKELITLVEAQMYINQCKDIIDDFYSLNEYCSEILELSIQSKLSFYDAQYLFLAVTLKAQLLTRDKKLSSTAKKWDVVK